MHCIHRKGGLVLNTCLFRLKKGMNLSYERVAQLWSLTRNQNLNLQALVMAVSGAFVWQKETGAQGLIISYTNVSSYSGGSSIFM